ncbi:MAG: guanylate kinase [bacterium]
MQTDHKKNHIKTAKLIIISGPSGSGKDTIANLLLKNNGDLEKAITTTTRKHRGKEKDGRDYYFIPPLKFKTEIMQEKFLEWAEVHIYLYGTYNSEISRIVNLQKIPVLVIDVQGALNVKKLFPAAILFFIKPPSTEIMSQRIKNRAAISEEEVKVRLKTARKELKMAKYYDHIIKNPEGHPEKAALKISKILKEYLK